MCGNILSGVRKIIIRNFFYIFHYVYVCLIGFMYIYVYFDVYINFFISASIKRDGLKLKFSSSL